MENNEKKYQYKGDDPEVVNSFKKHKKYIDAKNSQLFPPPEPAVVFRQDKGKIIPNED